MEGQEKAEKIAELYTTPRYRRLDRLERYVDGSIYDGRPDFFTPGTNVPLLERKPAFIYPVVSNAIRAHCDLVMGEDRWPGIAAKRLAEGKKSALGTSLDPTSAEKVDALLLDIVHQARLKPQMRKALERAMEAGAVAIVGGVREGKVSVEIIRSKKCFAVDRDRGGNVTRLEVRYPFIEEFRNEQTRRWEKRCMLYRRIIDAERDTVFQPAKGHEDGREPDWTEDPEKTTAHGLGFCPVRWYAYGGEDEGNHDGAAPHKDLTDEVDLMNVALSQRARAAHYCGDPQMYEAGVDGDYNPAPMGREPRVIIKPDELEKNWRFALAERSRPARMKGSGVVWRYPNPDTKVGMLTLPGDALKALDDHCKDARAKIEETLGVVFVDPTQAKLTTEVSGKAQELLYKRQTDRGSQIREDFGDEGLLATVSLLLRIALVVESTSPGAIYLDSLAEAIPILKRFDREVRWPDGQTTKRWFPCELDLTWGPFFASTAPDDKAEVDTTATAKNGGLISKRTAVAKVAPIFGIKNIDDEIEAIDKDAEDHANLEAAMQTMIAEGADGAKTHEREAAE